MRRGEQEGSLYEGAFSSCDSFSSCHISFFSSLPPILLLVYIFGERESKAIIIFQKRIEVAIVIITEYIHIH